MEVKYFSKDEWKKISKEVHSYAFNTRLENDDETISFALMAIKENEPQAYCTLIEMDKYTCYMQHGGALPAAKGTINVAKGYARMVYWLQQKYPKLHTTIKNDNNSMLRLAMSAGFKIIGVEAHDDGTFLSLINKSENKNG